MNTILLQPTDVLFFRDGRPMGGASAGHGAAWPLPTVVNHAFHAALHRAGDVFKDTHPHRRGRSGVYEESRDRRFGSLVTAGPFPVCTNGADHTWFFPRPADADDSGCAILHPFRTDSPSSLQAPCRSPVTSTKPPSKESAEPWWSEGAWNAYVGSPQRSELSARPFLKKDGDFADTEHTYGIGIDPDTGTVEEGKFYSANYLRLREGWKLGVLATASDKDYHHAEYGSDLIRALLNGHGAEIIAGGQQRICTATLETHATERLPLPLGLIEGFTRHDEKWLVKWVLLTPAIWPEIAEGQSNRGTHRKFHPGGWLPNWICPQSGQVLLETINDEERRRRRNLNASGKGYSSNPNISANLVAAIVPKPIPVTGWALPNETDRPEGGAKSTHLAVAAGAVYYFEASSPEDAAKLAAALNWHGNAPTPTTIKNRRSTLMGEKGFGLGVCGTWQFIEDVAGRPAK
jgi:hypothetical protein